MRIKEVCAALGITERAVRYYEKEGLLHPHILRVNGRAFRSYTPDNLETLRTIATLRRLDFSTEEIARMQGDAAAIPGIIACHCQALEERLAALHLAHSALEAAQTRSFASVDELANCLSPAARAVPLPDEKPLFWQIDRQQVRDPGVDFDAWQAAMLRRGTRTVYALAIVNALFSLALFVFTLGDLSFFTLLTLLAGLGLSAGLALGVRWIRWYMALSAAAGLTQAVVLALGVGPEAGAFFWCLLGAYLLFCGALVYCLLFFPPVREYFARRDA